MTWQERVKQLEKDGKFEQASRVFAFSLPNASYTQKMKFADELYGYKAYTQALSWYEECFDVPIAEECRYLTETGGGETLSERENGILKKADRSFEAGDLKNALEYYRLCVPQSRYATVKIAECYFLQKEYEKAKRVYRALAQETDEGYFMFMLGECYIRQPLNEYAFEHAVYWYEEALTHGNAYAYYPLGIACQLGRGTGKDLARAEALFEQGTQYSVDKDNCLCKLGNFCYERGEYKKARVYYEKACALNNARALLNLAIGIVNGDFSETDKTHGVCLLAKSSALGNVRAMEIYRQIKKEIGK